MTRTKLPPYHFPFNAKKEQKMNFRKLTQKRLRNRVKPVWGGMRVRKHELTVSNNSGRSDNDQLPPYHLPLNAISEQKMIKENISHYHLDKRVNPIWDDYDSLIEQAVLYQDVYCIQDLNPEMEKAIHISAIKENKIFLSEGYDLGHLVDKDIESIWNKFYGEAA